MARDRQQVLLKFPMKGVVVTRMKNLQPEETCQDASNVRPFDMIESRSRGGSRPGLTKYSSARSSANRVQDLNYVTILSNSLSATSLSRRTITPVAVTNGVIAKFNTTAFTNATVSGTQALGNATQVPFAFSTELFQRLYYCSGFGYKIYVGANNAAIDWSPSAGSLPGDQGNNVVCRLIEQWRGRIVLSGLPTDPHNWFMSKLGDPLNFDYAPATETELDAVTGGSGFVGKVPDVINAIIPYNDDVLIFGCDHSIWMMSGDPQAGGRLDLVTGTVGMAFGRPYAQLPDGTLMFMSNRGSVYRMAPGGGKPEGVTADNIDPLITNTNLNTNLVRMMYDESEDGVHLYITPLAGSTNTTHWYYDVRNNGWFKVVFPDNLFNPVALLAFDGDAPGDRVLMLGGDDGYVRTYSSSASRDDGQTFTSYVTMGPIVFEKGRLPTILTDVQFIMDNTSGNTVYELGVGDTAETALGDFAATLTGETDYAGTTINIIAGKSINHNPRTRGYFQYFKIGTTAPAASAPWAIEYIQASYQVVKTSRGRVAAEEDISFQAPDQPPSLVNSAFLYGAWWAREQSLTLDASNNVSAWAPFQAGDGQSPPTFANTTSTQPVFTVANSTFNNKGTLTVNGTLRGFTASLPAADVNFSSGFVTMALWWDGTGASSVANKFAPWQFVESGNTIGAYWEESGIINHIQWTGTSPADATANTNTANSTLYIMTWAGGTWRVFQSTSAIRQHIMENNQGIWVGSHGAGTHTLTVCSGGTTAWGIKLGAIAIYNNTQDNTIIRNVENAMATFYGFTIP